MMSKSAIPLALATVALVAACAYPVTPAPAPVPVVATPAPAPVVVSPAPGPVVVVPQQQPPAVVTAPVPQTVVVPPAIRPGVGRVESITGVPPSSGRTYDRTTLRLGIKMGDGTVQYVDSEVPNVAIGDRVELTANGYILHPI